MSAVSAAAIAVRVRARNVEARDIVTLELVPVAGALPPFTAGAHIDVHLPNGLVRQYSLANDPAERDRYLIAVQRDRASRGGSVCVHEALHEGATVAISPPRNHFPLVEDAPHVVLVGGGIGVTPLLAMAARLQALGRSWELVYCARTREHAAARDALAVYGERVRFNFDEEPGGRLLDLASLVTSAPAGTHFYCCGPAPMLAAFEAAIAARPGFGHVEYFSPKPAPPPGAQAPDHAFTVQLARAGTTLQVDADRSLLDTLIDAGFDLPYSCQEGVCGSCETVVLAGAVDHRDSVLSDAEKLASRSMMICCSRARGDHLVLDL